jgi:hypothetical protein
MPLKLTKKHLLKKEKKINLEMNYTKNILGFDKLNILTFNYIHSKNVNHKINNSFKNKRKISQENNSVKYRNLFHSFHNNRNSSTKKDKNINKKNLIHTIPKYANNHLKCMNSLSNYEMNKREKEILKIDNISNRKENKNILYNSNKKKIQKYHSNSPCDINFFLKRGNSKKSKDKNSHSKNRNINRNHKNNY